ncbi:hypothetical protein [Hoylesella saccharolytica]|uniref:hypothetical protein n=1 Tax=Hoylesella saccharolytica TaxID=633701 RepID=UPI0028D1E6AA|nr:hypothetical protein [Hoylesella saccharolytica]
MRDKKAKNQYLFSQSIGFEPQKLCFYRAKVHIKYEKRKNVAITLSIKDLKGLLEAA